MTRPAISLRRASLDDLKFVRDSWLQSYRKGGFAPEVAFPLYQRGQGELVARLAGNYAPVVAYATAVPDEICGWVCGFQGVVHYVYVKQAYRRMKIASQLVDGCTEYTHETRAGKRLFAKLGLKFNPYVLRHI